MNLKTFVEYCWLFYGPHQIHGDFFDHKLTRGELEAAALLRSKHPLFEGDSVDREAVRDLIFAARGKPLSF